MPPSDLNSDYNNALVTTVTPTTARRLQSQIGQILSGPDLTRSSDSGSTYVNYVVVDVDPNHVINSPRKRTQVNYCEPSEDELPSS